jgi:hypothetical protein
MACKADERRCARTPYVSSGSGHGERFCDGRGRNRLWHGGLKGTRHSRCVGTEMPCVATIGIGLRISLFSHFRQGVNRPSRFACFFPESGCCALRGTPAA